MEREPFVIATTERGRIAVAPEAIAQIVGAATAESYGVVALAGRGKLSRLVPWGIKKGVDVDLRADGLVVELRVVVEHGLKLAEVAERVRSRVLYELDRMETIARAQVGFAGIETPERWPRPRSAPKADRLESSIETLHGVGPTLARRLAKLGLVAVEDVLWQRPRRYEEAAPLKRICDLFGDDEAVIDGMIVRYQASRRAYVAKGGGTSATLTL